MASALLASRNEPYWGERKVYMRKNPNSNPNPKSNPNLKKPIFDPQDQIHGRKSNESTPMAAAAAAISDDSTSLNRKSISLNSKNNNQYITFNIAECSKRELREIKKRLISELEQVRNLRDLISSREIQSRSGYSASQFSVNSATTRPQALNLFALDSQPTLSGSDGMKEKRTPKANQYYRPSEFVMGKEKMMMPAENKKGSGSKRPPLIMTPRDQKRPALEHVNGKILSGIMKRCGQILMKIMKHKHGWIFNVPVDVVGMGLHDYNQIIKNPMDLGTVKSKLGRNIYGSPIEFASDVRLTFNNALAYNPKGHDVYVMAEQLLGRFEEMFGPAYRKYEEEQRRAAAMGSSWAQIPTPDSVRRPGSSRSQIPTPESTRKPEPIMAAPAPAPAPAPAVVPTPNTFQYPQPVKTMTTMRSATGKLPKPKAKDPNKRDMSYEEKQKLSSSLVSLPQEKMDQVVQIIRRRNSNLSQHGDEIEVDIEVVDKETLWELDRFVYNCKKMMSKIKRQALAANQISSAGDAAVNGGDKSPVGETLEAAKKSKKGEQGEEDIDIGDEMPSMNFPPVEIEKDAGYASRSSSSSSSSSGSSSSSDSDSGSSSESDSDADDAQLPGAGSKASPRN
ncbi:transcription factor GTE7-like [Tasmannia lanceolata]|uniref:transcription factor GTE7-like n=1 Tax=Tasmannia lanceolata TaxID=3420 RepID=UPI0040635143